MTLKVAIRTRGGHSEGMGDVATSLALALEFQTRGHEAVFFVNNNPNVISLLKNNSLEYKIAEDGPGLEAALGQERFDISVMVQLKTPEAEGRMIRERSVMMATVDDTGPVAQMADLRFNVLYPTPNSITGLEYVSLSDVYRQKHAHEKQINKDVRTVMVAQGGSDTYGFTPKILRALYGLDPEICVNVIIGPNFTHWDELNAALNAADRAFEVIEGLGDLSGVMEQADAAVTAGGNTLFEVASMGVPAVVVCGETFEVATAERLEREGFGKCLGFGRDVNQDEITSALTGLIEDYELRRRMSLRGPEMIDGAGTVRMVDKMIKQAEAAK